MTTSKATLAGSAVDIVPKRLVVHAAHIPTGDSCEGCEHLSKYSYGTPRIQCWCGDSTLDYGWNRAPIMTEGLRTDACRARDTYQIVAPTG